MRRFQKTPSKHSGEATRTVPTVAKSAAATGVATAAAAPTGTARTLTKPAVQGAKRVATLSEDAKKKKKEEAQVKDHPTTLASAQAGTSSSNRMVPINAKRREEITAKLAAKVYTPKKQETWQRRAIAPESSSSPSRAVLAQMPAILRAKTYEAQQQLYQEKAQAAAAEATTLAETRAKAASIVANDTA